MTGAWLRQPAAPLLAFGREMGIPNTSWPEREDLESLSYTNRALDASCALRLTLDTVDLLRMAYGDSLTCRFLLGDYPVLTVSGATDQAALARFAEELQGSPTVELDFRIDKAGLAEDWFGLEPCCRRFLYFFAGSFASLLHSKLRRLETLLWGSDAAAKVVVLIPELDIWLDGEYLAVIGGARIIDWRDAVPTAPPEASAAQAMYRGCRENLMWQEPYVRFITPIHLDLVGSTQPRDPIANALLAQGANLVLLYTADRTATDASDNLVAVYEGAGQSVPVNLADPRRTLPEDAAAGIANLFQMARWVYEPRWLIDRLALAQLAIAQTLAPIPAAERYRRLIEAAANVFGNLRWHWKAFIEAKLDAYDAQVHKLEDDVSDAVKAFSDQITDMIKGLSETMLAAVAAVLGSIVAALFRDKFNPAVFSIGMIAYAVYVAAFPLGFGMANQYARYRSLKERFEARKASYVDILPTEKVAEITAQPLARGEERYRQWFFATVAAYLVVIILSIGAALVVPTLVQISP